MTSHSIPFGAILTPREPPDEQDRDLRESQQIGTLLRARMERESERTDALLNRWRRRGTSIEDDVFPRRSSDTNGATE